MNQISSLKRNLIHATSHFIEAADCTCKLYNISNQFGLCITIFVKTTRKTFQFYNLYQFISSTNLLKPKLFIHIVNFKTSEYLDNYILASSL